MTVRKILVLSTVLGVSLFAKAWASDGLLDGADEGQMTSSPVVVLVDSEKAEDDTEGQSSSLIQGQADAPQVHREPMTKAALFKCLVGVEDISEGNFWPTKFDRLIAGTEEGRDKWVEQLVKKATSEGLAKVMADAGNAFCLFKAREQPPVQRFELHKLQAPGDIANLIPKLYLLFQTFSLAVQRNDKVILDDFIALSEEELLTLKSTLELYNEMSFLGTTGMRDWLQVYHQSIPDEEGPEVVESVEGPDVEEQEE